MTQAETDLGCLVQSRSSLAEVQNARKMRGQVKGEEGEHTQAVALLWPVQEMDNVHTFMAMCFPGSPWIFEEPSPHSLIP